MAKIGVLLATYNGEKYIRDLLESLVKQTFKDFKCYIHDDGSSDKTLNICREYSKKRPDLFMILDYPAVGGAKENFFSLMKRREINEEYIMFCDQDDIWMPDKMKIMYERILDNSECLVYSDLKIVDSDLRVIYDSFYKAYHTEPRYIDYKNAIIRGYIPGCAILVSRGVIKNALRYKQESSIKMHDWWVVLVALMTGTRMIYVGDQLTLYRQHNSNTIGAKNISLTSRIFDNMKLFWSGEIFAEKKKNLYSPIAQVRELYECKIGEKRKLMFVSALLHNTRDNKIKRILFYRKNFKHVYRLWWTLIWI